MNSDDKRMARGGHGSHWDGCEEVHWDCRIKMLERQLAEAERRAVDAGKVRDELYQVQRKRAAAEAIVDRLPKTADGVPVVPGMELWHAGTSWSGKGDYAWCFYRRPSSGELEVVFTLCSVLVSQCYSTRAAAEAAKEPTQ
jgi:hypothetical protein